MDNLYFTLASLPHLEPAGPAPFADLNAFWAYVDHVPDEWKTQFSSSTASDPTVRAYREWDLAVRTALARLRLEGLSWKDQESTLPAVGAEWTTRALEILEQPTPLDAERVLDELRWDFIEDLGQGHQFDRVAFFVYALKLELVQRRSRLVRDRGQEAFDGLHTSVLAKTDLTIPTGEKS